MPTDTKINLVINKLTKSQYDTAVANNQISGSELYCITDVTEIPVTAVNPVTTTGTLTSIGINGTNYALPTPLLPITSVNPATSTATLTSIGINGTNYELAGSGGDADITYASELPSDTTGIDDGAYYAIPADDSGSGGGGSSTPTAYLHNVQVYSITNTVAYCDLHFQCISTTVSTALTTASGLSGLADLLPITTIASTNYGYFINGAAGAVRIDTNTYCQILNARINTDKTWLQVVYMKSDNKSFGEITIRESDTYFYISDTVTAL